MGKATVFLMALAVALAAVVGFAHATPPGLRRSRFLATKLPQPPLAWGNCEKRPAVCKEHGSPGKDCCNDMCTDTKKNSGHCGECGKKCKYGDTCCDGKCVDLLNDKKNCGDCNVQCSNKCRSGMCNYAG
ncbi:hypothetical protein ACQ4PT_045528 [Festuca glaucescens]